MHSIIIRHIKYVSQDPYAWLMEISSCHWSRHEFNDSAKVDHVINHIIKFFNSYLDKHRSKPILTFLECLRRKIMKNMQKRKSQALTWEVAILPQIQLIVDKVGREGRHI